MLVPLSSITDAVPVRSMAVASGISTLKMAFFAEVRREFIQKTTFAFSDAVCGELERCDTVSLVGVRLYQA